MLISVITFSFFYFGTIIIPIIEFILFISSCIENEKKIRETMKTLYKISFSVRSVYSLLPYFFALFIYASVFLCYSTNLTESKLDWKICTFHVTGCKMAENRKLKLKTGYFSKEEKKSFRLLLLDDENDILISSAVHWRENWAKKFREIKMEWTNGSTHDNSNILINKNWSRWWKEKDLKRNTYYFTLHDVTIMKLIIAAIYRS